MSLVNLGLLLAGASAGNDRNDRALGTTAFSSSSKDGRHWMAGGRMGGSNLLRSGLQGGRAHRGDGGSFRHSRHTTVTATNLDAVGAADLDWPNLGFEFRETNSHLKFTWRACEGWDDGELISGEPFMKLHIASTGLHYGQSCFEGLKAFARKDGSVSLFRPDENAKRMQRSAARTMMPALDEQAFVNACRRVVADNVQFVPPYGSGGALYLRPLLFGSGPRIGLQPAEE